MHRSRAIPLCLALIGLSGPALAVDLSTALEIWNLTETSATGDATAQGVAIDTDGNYYVVGWEDGGANSENNAFIRQYNNLGTADWT
jgi:hypothetical protein